ncbi:hypothetical protein [Thermomonas mangrovi]|jgi:hypothetical protein|uniref:hypothetical protein n=1 Tax=Thermomonas mangrovi TaxID=2993316 RepID=UPI002307766C|nr:hypothetical protein [Thermomonas mangrovi]
MCPRIRISLISFAVVLVVSGCKPAAEPTSQDAAPADSAVASAAPATWPASLNVMGDGFPNAGDACRRIGETEATVNYLDDSATLAGCLSADEAAKLGGTVVGTVDGVTLVSVPNTAAIPGDGDGQGDAKVAGTDYNATGPIRCSGYKGAAAGMCEAGVVRDAETGPYIEVTLPDGVKRTIFFNKDGSFLSFSTAQADGTAAMPISSSREGDTTIATLGTERYEIPDVFVQGD